MQRSLTDFKWKMPEATAEVDLAEAALEQMKVDHDKYMDRLGATDLMGEELENDVAEVVTAMADVEVAPAVAEVVTAMADVEVAPAAPADPQEPRTRREVADANAEILRMFSETHIADADADPALEEWEPGVGALDALAEKGQSIEVALEERKEEEQRAAEEEQRAALKRKVGDGVPEGGPPKAARTEMAPANK